MPGKKKNTNEPKRTSSDFSIVTVCCTQQCFHAVTPEEQRFLYDNFKAGDKPSQDRMLGSYLQFKKTNGRTEKDPNGKQRNYHWSYVINIFSRSLPVCCKFIQTLFGFGGRRFRTIQKKIVSGCVFQEKRGKHGNQWNKNVRSHILPIMLEHLSMFPTVTSHYSRSSTSKLYFTNSLLTGKKLYRLFRVYYKEKTKQKLDLSYKTYAKYFRTLPRKYGFRRPRTDVCDYCTEQKLKIQADPLNVGYRHALLVHEQKVQQYQTLKKYITNTKIQKCGCAFEFDYAQNLSIPKLNNSSVFYKRLLSLYVFNVHSHDDNDSIFYTYLECDGAKNAAAVCSFLYNFITQKMLSPSFQSKTEITLFSDSCGGQNKNLTVSKFLSCFAKHLNKEIEQIFPVRGHSYCQCDRNFGLYGRTVNRHSTITHYKKYLDIMVNARDQPFRLSHDASIMRNINRMTGDMTICKTQKLRKTDVFPIQQYVRIRYTPLGTILASKTYLANYEQYYVQKIPATFDVLNLPPAEKVKLKSGKILDLQSLLIYMPEKNKPWLEDVIALNR